MTQYLSSTRYSRTLRRFSGHAYHFINKLGCKQNEQLHFILVHDPKNQNKRFSSSSNHPAMTLHKPLNLLEKSSPQFTLFSKRNKHIHVLSQNKRGYAVFMEINYRETKSSEFNKIRAQFIDVDLNKISVHLDTKEQVKQMIESIKADPTEQFQSITVKKNKQGRYHLLALRKKQRVKKLKNAFIKKYRNQIKDTMIVETKNGYHIYWVVQGGSVSKFVPIQKALAKKFSSDPMITNLSRVMRIPGFFHMKNPQSPFMVRIRQLGRKKPFSQEEIINSLALGPIK
ncbi:DNA-primase RepB domain-containing protein [Paenibacillus sp. NPDC058071]|uniref:DNA-primase RepB domain-containing protein n=1 Tax=Paenibacillus sp. NPDC058071 TaxID=3346326 RepID=UPI0036DDD5DC